MPKELDPELLEQLTAGLSPDELVGSDGLFKKLKKAILEKALEGEMAHHLGYERNDPAGDNSGNSRNGKTTKKVITADGEFEVSVPRDRNGTFEPVVVPKGQRRLPGFDEKVIGLYARGLSVREVQEHLEELYEIDVSPDLISRVTDSVLDEVVEWQNRTLDPLWPIVYLDALVVKVRHNGSVQNRSFYLALGVNRDGLKEVLGIWVADSEGAKFWLQVVTELQNRGVKDILVACCDGLKGFPEAIEAVFPRTVVQTCIVHMVRNSLRYVSWGSRRAVAKGLRSIYQAATVEQALEALDDFEAEWGQKYPSIVTSWRRNWERVSPFFAFGKDIRRAVYTTNAIEALNRQLRKVLKTRGHFPTDRAAFKVMWLALRRASKNWSMPVRQWDLALQQFEIHFPGRVFP